MSDHGGGHPVESGGHGHGGEDPVEVAVESTMETAEGATDLMMETGGEAPMKMAEAISDFFPGEGGGGGHGHGGGHGGGHGDH